MIKVKDLINRPIIRNDFNIEFLNKMTDNEIHEFFSEISDSILKGELIPPIHFTKIIDFEILYNLTKLGKT